MRRFVNSFQKEFLTADFMIIKTHALNVTKTITSILTNANYRLKKEESKCACTTQIHLTVLNVKEAIT